MKAIIMSIVVCFSASNVSAVRADDLGRARSGLTERAGQPAGASESWRYKFQQGHWWYWLPANRWAVYENGRWLMPPRENPQAAASFPSAGETTSPARQEKMQATLVRGQTAVINRMLREANDAAGAAEEEQRRHEQDQRDRVGVDWVSSPSWS